MSNQENNNKSNSSDANNSTDKGKAKFISAISNSANELIRETLIPSSGSNVTTLLQQINEQKPQQSSTTSTSTFFLQELNNKISQEGNENRFRNVNYNNEENYNINKDWEQWILNHNVQYMDKIEPCPSAKSHMYPFHHHYPHKTNLINENFEDGNEIIGFLNSNDYTNQVYNEEFNQTTLNGKEDSKFILEEFLENEDIEKYLLKTTYTDDVYGIPKFLKKLIIEAKNELNNNKNDQDENITLKHQRTAIERLKMVRDHLIEKRKLNNSNNNNDDDDNNDIDIDIDNELFKNWLDKAEQDVKDI
ncbi:hypothetical protein RhiirA5_418017 [Rhizophagus irregularis]|uniref:Uncharacterized protein n=2 Tax=Rhizophagus irregularis TaxID=588596 RepID=A0A2I1EQS0_9GLOM|nr:hypothetical protein RhiirA5_418017 [Rhizophagus irregularis]PKC63233.1 hypothetical protein RhiirA1_519778 [Rhizophagus irregularis]PKY24469.1 hypothetical protein RhiirB3_439042 [Rhizophagus irregularis]CAB4485048.1 unnamed protein product [Rhizophagus irregularis]CAB5215640.1 unnamed protein product [Rhizophagus irregularis]